MELVAFPCGYLAEAKSVNASDPYDSVSAFFFCAAACHFSGELPITFAHRFRSMVDFGVWCPGRKFEDRYGRGFLTFFYFYNACILTYCQ